MSGTVFEHTSSGSRPLAGLRLHLRARVAIPDVTTDASGRYEVAGVPQGVLIVAPALETEYRGEPLTILLDWTSRLEQR